NSGDRGSFAGSTERSAGPGVDRAASGYNDHVSSAESGGSSFAGGDRGPGPDRPGRNPGSTTTGRSLANNGGGSPASDNNRGRLFVPRPPAPAGNTTETTAEHTPRPPGGIDNRNHRRIYRWTGHVWAPDNNSSDSGRSDVFYDYGGGYYFDLGDVADTQAAVDAYLASLPTSARRSVVDECRT